MIYKDITFMDTRAKCYVCKESNIVFMSIKIIVSIRILSFLIDLLTQNHKRPFTWQ